MPIYEYQCQDCGEEIEVLQKISDPPAVNCPACGKPSLRKKVSAAAFRLKGGGWYKDLYSSTKPETKSESSEKPAEKAADKPADKPVEKADKKSKKAKE